MKSEKDIIRAGLQLLLDKRSGDIFELPPHDKATMDSFICAVHDNSVQTLGGKCGAVAALLRDYYRAYFRHLGIDGDCLRVTSADMGSDFHYYNLVRIKDKVLLLDGLAAQFICPPKESFPPHGVFIGERTELKTILSHAITTSREILCREWPEVGDLDDSLFYRAVATKDIREECFRLFKKSGRSCLFVAPYNHFWQKAWGHASVAVADDDWPGDPSRWGKELSHYKFDAAQLDTYKPSPPRKISLFTRCES
ncbi:MAG: hypothetical protein PHY92_01940 [Alphaproteobacteria bacterium]|nr:hypothetical protein [Alphaproteobacteria bacterium]